MEHYYRMCFGLVCCGITAGNTVCFTPLRMGHYCRMFWFGLLRCNCVASCYTARDQTKTHPAVMSHSSGSKAYCVASCYTARDRTKTHPAVVSHPSWSKAYCFASSWHHSMLYSLKNGTSLQDAFWFGLLRCNSWQHSWQNSMLYSMKDGTPLQDAFWFGLLRCNSWQHSWQNSMLYSMKDGTSVQDVFWFSLLRSNSWQLAQFALLLQ